MKAYSFQSVHNFATASPILRDAVKSAFDGVLDLEYVETECQKSYEYSWDRGVLPTWLETDCYALVGDDVREVRLSGSLLYPQGVQQCFKSPALTKLVIRDRPCEFTHLRCMSNLRVLEMTCHAFPKLRSFLKSMSIPILDLQELNLHSWNSKCLHEDFAENVEHQSLLASWFPRVEKLCLKCEKCEFSDQPSYASLWSVIEKFRELKQVTITEHVPKHAVERLRNMERVEIAGGNHIALAENLSAQVGSLSRNYIQYPSYDQLRNDRMMFDRLAKCEQLEHFSCYIPPGSETGLVKIAKNLRSLFLGFQRYPDASMYPEQDQEHEAKVAEEINSDAILHALRAAPHLSNVEFDSPAGVRADKLCEMLVVLGDRLEEFGASIIPWNTGGAVDDVEQLRQELREVLQVLKTAAIHNPSLTKLWLGWRLERLSYDTKLVESCLAEQAILPILSEFRATCSVLQRRAPRLDTGWLKRVLRRLMASCSQPISSSEESDWSD